MRSYIFQADIYCENCGEELCRDTPRPAGMNRAEETTWDSDAYPKGPYEVGEADSPQHCASCGCFLENTLTDEGDRWLREQAQPYEIEGDQSWHEVAEAVEADGKPHLAEWIDFYYSPGF